MQTTKMDWSNLKKNKCPKCGKDWSFDLKVVYGMDFAFDNGKAEPLYNHGCGFQIRESRYKQIVSGMVTKELEEKWNAEGGEYAKD